MRSQIYRKELDGPDLVRLSGRGDLVDIDCEGRRVGQVLQRDVRRGVAISLGDGREVALLGGGGADRIVVKLDGERLRPVVIAFDWVAYVPAVLLAVGVAGLAIGLLAYFEIEWAWRLAIRREALLIGLLFLGLHRSRAPWAMPAGAIVMFVDIIYVLDRGISNPVTLALRLLVVAYLARAAVAHWQAPSSESST